MVLYNDFVGEDRYSKHDGDSFKVVLKSPDNYVFVAEENGKIIGFATVSVRTLVRYPKPIAELDELFVAEEFRKHGITAKASFGRDSVKSQLRISHRLGIKYTLIMGQKEAMDEMVILRDVKSGMQEVISYDKIVEEVKKRLGK